MNTFEKIKEMIIEELGVDADKVTMESRFKEDLGADSLDAVELVMGVEEAFGIEVGDDVINNLKVVADIVNYIDANK